MSVLMSLTSTGKSGSLVRATSKVSDRPVSVVLIPERGSISKPGIPVVKKYPTALPAGFSL